MAGIPEPIPVDPAELHEALRFAPQCVHDAIANMTNHGARCMLRIFELEAQLQSALAIQRRQKLLADELMERIVQLTHSLAATGDDERAPSAGLLSSQAAMTELLNRLKKGSSS